MKNKIDYGFIIFSLGIFSFLLVIIIGSSVIIADVLRTPLYAVKCDPQFKKWHGKFEKKQWDGKIEILNPPKIQNIEK